MATTAPVELTPAAPAARLITLPMFALAGLMVTATSSFYLAQPRKVDTPAFSKRRAK